MAQVSSLKFKLCPFELGHLEHVSDETLAEFERRLQHRSGFVIDGDEGTTRPAPGLEPPTIPTAAKLAQDMLEDESIPLLSRYTLFMTFCYAASSSWTDQQRLDCFIQFDRYITRRPQPSETIEVATEAFAFVLKPMNIFTSLPDRQYKEIQACLKRLKTHDTPLGAIFKPELLMLASLCAFMLGNASVADSCLRKCYQTLSKVQPRGSLVFVSHRYPRGMVVLFEKHDRYLLTKIADMMRSITSDLKAHEAHCRAQCLLHLVWMYGIMATPHRQDRRHLPEVLVAPMDRVYIAIATRAPPSTAVNFNLFMSQFMPAGRQDHLAMLHLDDARAVNLLEHVHAGTQEIRLWDASCEPWSFLLKDLARDHMIPLRRLNQRLIDYGYNVDLLWLVEKFHSMDKNEVRINHNFELMRRLLAAAPRRE
eukprot:TRINITY_DN12434_c1_g5_i1.p2 TRINITY_DN12434_c1_g5~~TRINITY_DN12434_c1_g5_i1.p2  ORF type:complete len:423 (+),score=35.79 TRINITY_DN12434_c1_g5_i1:1652-2920(+)